MSKNFKVEISHSTSKLVFPPNYNLPRYLDVVFNQKYITNNKSTTLLSSQQWTRATWRKTEKVRKCDKRLLKIF